MKLASLFAGFVCGAQALWPRAPAVKQPAGVECLEVATYVTQYVATPVYHTVTETVSVVATALPTSHSPSDGFVASPRPPLDAHPSAPLSKSRRDFSPAVLLYGIGQWLDEPLNLSPWDILCWTFFLTISLSWLVFFFSKSNRDFMWNTSGNICRAFVAGSYAVWTIVLWTVSYLGAGPVDPIDWLCERLITLAANHPYAILQALLVIPRWWHPHKGQGGQLSKALWADVKPALLQTCQIWRAAFVASCNKLPDYSEYAIERGPALAFDLFIMVATVVAMIWRWIFCPPLRFFLGLLRSSHVVGNLLVRYVESRPLLYDTQRYVSAHNLDIPARMKLEDTIVDARADLHEFNTVYTVALAQHCLSYRWSMFVLMHHVNYLLTCLDTIANEDMLRRNKKGIPHSALYGHPAPINSPKFFWSPELTDAGVHFRVERPKCAHEDWHQSFFHGPSFGHVSNTHLFPHLFQKDPWGLDRRFFDVELPSYDKIMEGPPRTDCDLHLFEDVAAAGNGVAVWRAQVDAAKAAKAAKAASADALPRIPLSPVGARRHGA